LLLDYVQVEDGIVSKVNLLLDLIAVIGEGGGNGSGWSGWGWSLSRSQGLAALIAEFAILNVNMLAMATNKLSFESLATTSAETGTFGIFSLAFRALHGQSLLRQ